MKNPTRVVEILNNFYIELCGSSRSRTRVTMKKRLIMVCALAILAAVVAMAGCGGGSSSSGTPEQAAKAFWAAALRKDTDATWKMLSGDSQGVVKDKTAWSEYLKELDIEGKTVTYEVDKSVVDGDQATVTLKFKANGKDEGSTEMTMVREGGAWKYSLPPQ